MGAHRAPTSRRAARLAGRGALTAAAALALTGGTASLAFAADSAGDDHGTYTAYDANDVATHVQKGAADGQGHVAKGGALAQQNIGRLPEKLGAAGEKAQAGQQKVENAPASTPENPETNAQANDTETPTIPGPAGL